MAGSGISSEWLERVLIGLLATREAYGFEMTEAVQRAAEAETGVAGSANLPEGAIYPALRHLERGGILCAHWVEVGAGVPRRRYYALTPEGQRVAAAATADRVYTRTAPSRVTPAAARP